MKFLVYVFFIILFVIIGEKIISLAINGQLFKEGSFKQAYREAGKQLWLGMRLFVILWLGYLIFTWFIQHKN